MKRFLSKYLNKIVLGIETSCDDTGVGIIKQTSKLFQTKKQNFILGESLVSHNEICAKFGGVHPKEMQKAHKNVLEDSIHSALNKSNLTMNDIDAIAVTYGPGLAMCLSVGVNIAKKYAIQYSKPLIPVNHLEAHLLSCRLEMDIQFPFLVLLVSGGHCLLAIAKNIGDYTLLGNTKDDSVGEAFDKIARLLGLPIIKGGGYVLSEHAKLGNENAFNFPIPMRYTKDFNFSYSGLKSSVLKKVRELESKKKLTGKELDLLCKKYRNIPNCTTTLSESITRDLAASFQKAAISQLCIKTKMAMDYCKKNISKDFNRLVLCGGVAANELLRNRMKLLCEENNFKLYVPPIQLCTDNGVMIAWAGIETFKNKLTKEQDIKNLEFNPRLKL